MINWILVTLFGCEHKEDNIIVKQDLGRTKVEQCKKCKTLFYISK